MGNSWNHISDSTGAGISIKSFNCETKAKSPIEGNFSLGIFFATFESRGLVSSRLLKKNCCKNSLIILFDEKDNRGLRDKYDPLLKKQVSNCTLNEPIIINNISVGDVESALSIIFRKIPNDAWGRDRKWFIDITGSPKPHFLSLIGSLRGQIMAPSIKVFHPSGDYEKAETPEIAYTFTSGFDRYMWVPYMWGRPTPSLPWTYIFLLGFEGNRSYEIYTRFEPDISIAFIGKPAYNNSRRYVARAIEENKAFINEAKPTISYAHASDVASASEAIKVAISRVPQNNNICIVPLGPKPHALAGGLAALRSGKPAILYLMPRSYNAHDVCPGKLLWLYDITL